MTVFHQYEEQIVFLPQLPALAPVSAHLQQGAKAAKIAHSRWPGCDLDEEATDTAIGKWVFRVSAKVER